MDPKNATYSGYSKCGGFAVMLDSDDGVGRHQEGNIVQSKVGASLWWVCRIIYRCCRTAVARRAHAGDRRGADVEVEHRT
jgi:hypothetical protein